MAQARRPRRSIRRRRCRNSWRRWARSASSMRNGPAPTAPPPVTVIAQPGRAYHYSGGSYESAEALMADAMKAPFPDLMDKLVLKQAGMRHSSFAQPLPRDREGGGGAGPAAERQGGPG